MKNKIIKIIILFLILLAFLLINRPKTAVSHRILEVINPDTFYIDFNDDNKKDENELYKLKNVYAFYPELNEFSRKSAKNLHISDEQYLKTGFIAQNWAKDNLENKYVKVIDDKIYLNNIDIAKFYLENGLAFTSNGDYIQYQNINQIKNNASAVSKLDFVILNLKNNVFHKINCEFIDSIYRAKLILKNKAKDYIPCKICNVNYEVPKSSNFKLNQKFQNIELFLIDPHLTKRPNSKCTNETCKKLIDKIDKSKNSIDIALYGYGSLPNIEEALDRAKARGVKIRIVADNNTNYSNTLALVQKFDSKIDQSKSLMHNKFFIFDNKEIMTGSCNISPSGLGGYNSNIVAFIESDKIAAIYKAEFEQMYKGLFSKQKDNIQKSDINVGNSTVNIYFSPKDNIQNMILNEIKNAKQEICLSAFYLTDALIMEELIKAKAKGLKVFVILDATGANNFKKNVYSLRSANIPVIVENWGGKNHEKTLLIDFDTLIFGSCNFTKSGFFKNDENVVKIKNKEIAKFYRNYFFYIFNSINKKYLKTIPRSEGIESIGSCTDGIDNNFDGKIDYEDVGCK